MLALSTSSTSTHAHARPKTRVGVFEHLRAPRVRARAAASRETLWGNCSEVRRSTSGLSQYLSPEPMLQEPGWLRSEARDGFSTPTYAYARNNPISTIDDNGLWPSSINTPAGIAALAAAGMLTSTVVATTVTATSEPNSCADSPSVGSGWTPPELRLVPYFLGAAATVVAMGKKSYQCTTTCQSNGAPGGAYYISGSSSVSCSAATKQAKANVPLGQYPRHCSCSDTKGFRGTGTQCE